MSILASLANAYQRLPDAPPFGFSSEKIGFLISLNEDGTVACPPVDLRQNDKKRTPRTVAVPASFKRPGITPRSFFLWDNTAYALGVTGSESKDAASRYKVFCEYHLEALRDTTDPGLKALIIFLKTWSPRRFDEIGWPEEMKDQNIIFCLEADRRANIWLHDRPAAKALWSRLSAEGNKPEAICLISGEHAPVARLHPAIKNVWGAQSSGASIVSFNLDAFSSYGHEQGDNAPVSEAAAFAYTTALNRFLEKDSGHRIQIGDASVVFWADASDANKAAKAENIFASF
ncbi:CRISPR-associated protein Csd1, partial [Rhodomicrobium udaipurense JA643]